MLLAAQPKPLVFTHVTVIDATGAPAKFNQTVVINGSRIAKLGETGRVDVPKDANVINAAGKFLIPGLWDMHVHTASETFLLKKQGVDFMKLYNFLSHDTYFAIVSEAKKQGLPFAGHVPLSISAAEASNAGQKSIEHLTGILLACSSQETRLRSVIMDGIRQSNYSPREVNRLIFSAPPEEIVRTYNEEKAQALFARFANNGTWQVPTLFILKLITFGNEEYRNDARLKYMPPFI